MKMNTLTMAALGVLALGIAESQAAGVLTDPGFETPLVDDGTGIGKWGPFNAGPPSSAITTTTNPRNGASHLQLAMGGTANLFAGVFQDVNVLGGDVITFSGFHAATNNAPTGIEIRIEWRDSVGNAQISRTANFAPSPGTGYESFSLTDTAPAGADTARVVYALQSFGGSANSVVDVDDLSVTGSSVPEPSTSLLMSFCALGLVARRKR
jgi:hypothetical protein